MASDMVIVLSSDGINQTSNTIYIKTFKGEKLSKLTCMSLCVVHVCMYVMHAYTRVMCVCTCVFCACRGMQYRVCTSL